MRPLIPVETRDVLTEIHIADIHFGNKSTKIEDHFKILYEQFIAPISMMQFDLLSINGDLFDHKFMANSDVIAYAIRFVDLCVQLCRQRDATLVLLYGTSEHDADQLKLFYHYLEDPTIDLRIVEHAKFEYIKGHTYLYMPEEYSMGAEYYNKLLFGSGWYDEVCLHGTIAGSVHGCNEPNKDGIRAVFGLEDFCYCNGPIICGHVHKAQCIKGYIYYCGNPIRYKFGEEEDKGFIICLHNFATREFYVHFQKIESFRYDTVNIDDLLLNDPKDVIDYINGLKANGIDHIRVQFTQDNSTTEVVKKYFSSIPYVKIDTTAIKKQQTELQMNQNVFDSEEYAGLEFILDDSLDKKDILCKYANFLKGFTYITVDELVDLLKED